MILNLLNIKLAKSWGERREKGVGGGVEGVVDLKLPQLMLYFFRTVGNILQSLLSLWSKLWVLILNNSVNHVCRDHQDGRSVFFKMHILIASRILNLVNARFVYLEHILAYNFTWNILSLSLFSLLCLFFFSFLLEPVQAIWEWGIARRNCCQDI